MKNRNTTIDVAKGLGIILVVLGHNWIALDNRELFRVIFSFHMPLFFFLSGIFLKESDCFSKFLLLKASALLKPYFVILIAWSFVTLFLTIMKDRASILDTQYFLGLVWGTGNTIAIGWKPLWFLPHLFVTLSFALMILKLLQSTVNRRLWLGLTSCVLLSVGIYSISFFWHPSTIQPSLININSLPGLPWSIDLTPLTAGFILFGYLLRDQINTIAFNSINFTISMVIFISLHYYFDDTVDLSLRVYSGPVISTLQIILGIYIVISIAALLQRYTMIQKTLSYVGAGSLFILIFHGFLEGSSFGWLSKISEHVYFNSIASLLVGIFLPLIFLEIVKRQAFTRWLLLPKKSNSNVYRN